MYRGSWILSYASMWFLTLAYLNNKTYNYITLDSIAISSIGISSLVTHLPHVQPKFNKFDAYIYHICGTYLTISNADRPYILWCAIITILSSMYKPKSHYLVYNGDRFIPILYHLLMIYIPALFGTYMIVKYNVLEEKMI